MLPGLHPDSYSSKFPPLTSKRIEQLRPAVAEQRGGGAAGGKQDQLGRRSVGNARLSRERRWQGLLQVMQKRKFVLAAIEKAGQRGFTGKYLA